MSRSSVLVLFAFLFLKMEVSTQIMERFDDGDFGNNPVWVGNTADWIVNPSFQLQSNNGVAGSSFYLSTANALAATTQWEFYAKLSFTPSGNNYSDVFLTSSSSNLTLTNTSGYFVRLGHTAREISLFRKDANGTVSKIIDGIDNTLNSSTNNVMKVKVSRDAANQWILQRDMTGNGTSFTSEGSVTDATFTTSSFFGILVVQSTSSFFYKHFFDDIEIKTYVPDLTPPSFVSIISTSATTADVLFDEPVNITTAQTTTNYTVNNAVGNPISAIRDAGNNSLLHLTFGTVFPNGITLTMTINNVQDLSGNAITNKSKTFFYYTPQRYDIVLDELMADPTPQIGLPNNEWIELKNTSPFPIHLQNWRLSDANSQSGPFPNFTLQPDSFVIICTGSAVAAMAAFGTTISVTSFPSLDNEGDWLTLKNANGMTIHSVLYSNSWYQNELKKDGGWSLEMIDPKSPCLGSVNWRASVNTTGGTAGKKNSIDGTTPDITGPTLLRTFSIDNQTILVEFDEPLDSSRGSIASNYILDGGLTISNAQTLGPLFNQVQLKLATSMQANTVYNLTVSNVSDCKGNTIGNKNKAKAGLASDASPMEIIVNEILFDPRTTAYDYIEFYNRSNKIVDASKLYIANRNSSNVISSIKQLSAISFYLFPGEYLVLTQSLSSLQKEYLVKNPEAVLTLSTLPSYPDDKGFVLLLNVQGTVIDEVNYNKNWHFGLIENKAGIALERINPHGLSQDKTNWHSASSTAGYGTPTYKNSQFKQVAGMKATIEIIPKTFSPDNDGRDDITTIQYQLNETGYAANITVFDVYGRPVRYLIKNANLGLKGYWHWDGLDDKGLKLPIGPYIIFTEIFNLKGNRQTFKNTVILAKKLN